MAAARGDGGGIGQSGQCAGAAAVSRSALLSSSPILPAMAAPPCRRAGVGEGGGNAPPYCVSWAALRLDTFQVYLQNLTDQAAAIQVSKTVVKYLIRSLRECGSAAYLGCSLCSVSGA